MLKLRDFRDAYNDNMDKVFLDNFLTHVPSPCDTESVSQNFKPNSL